MPLVRLDHFERAAADVGSYGDNDTIPFDIENRFVEKNQKSLATLAYEYFKHLESGGVDQARKAIDSLNIFSERLLAPVGPTGFRVTTKIHPFWNLYFNGLGIAVGEQLEPGRSDRVHSYRFLKGNGRLFERTSSWKTFREATLVDCTDHDDGIVVQTDISSFYDHLYHHRIENYIADLFPKPSTVPKQIDRLLSKLASGRSFGLPVGGQCSRILAETVMDAIDQTLTNEKLIWRRYVDDFFILAANQAQAYQAISILSHALADYGLSLNKSKTSFLTTKHYRDYVAAQLGTTSDSGSRLREIDLHFDPYSDSAQSDYQELKETVQNIEIRTLLDLELSKGQPDTFLVAQIGRTLKYQTPAVALQLCETLLSPKNLHAFRASWSKIMRGMAAVRGDATFTEIFSGLDNLLDAVPGHSPHLLLPEANCLHYFRTIRFHKTPARATFVLETYTKSTSVTVRRACIDCWRLWKDRSSFIRLRNRFNSMGAEEQRMLWVAAGDFSDDGEKFRAQVTPSFPETCRLGIEEATKTTFESIYRHWTSSDVGQT